MEQKNRISVRINGREKWTERTKNEAAGKKAEKDFQWVLPEDRPTPSVVSLKQRRKRVGKRKKPDGQAPKLPVHRKKKPRRSPARKRKIGEHLPKKQWVSAFSAIVVGVIMGMIVLSIFTDHPHVDSAANSAHHPKSVTSQDSSSASTDAGKPEVAENLDLALQMVQGGVVSTKESAESAVNDLKTAGFAAVVNKVQNKFHLFIGVGLNEKNTEALGKLYKQQGQEVYVKSFPVQVAGDQLKSQVRRFLGEAKPVLTDMMEGSVKGLSSGKTGLTEKEWSGLEKQVKQLKKDVTTETQPLMEKINTAVKDLRAFREKSDTGSLWQAQQALLEAVLSYRSAGE